MDLPSAYLVQTSDFPLLGKEEETELAIRIGNGCQESLTRLVTSNLRLVIKEVNRRMRNTSSHYEDMIQEGNRGLMRAAEKFDPTFGNRFSTCAIPWIRQAILEYELKHVNAIRVPSSLYYGRGRANREVQDGEEAMDQFAAVLPAVTSLNVLCSAEVGEDDGGFGDRGLVDGTVPCPAESAHAGDLRELIRRSIAFLSPRSQEILCRRMGLGVASQSLAEVGDALRVTRERVRQLEKKSLEELAMTFVLMANPRLYLEVLREARGEESPLEEVLALDPNQIDFRLSPRFLEILSAKGLRPSDF